MARIDDEINDIKQSIAEQLRITEEETRKLNIALAGRAKIESEIEKMQRGLDTLEDRNLSLEEQISETKERLANKKNNQKTRQRLSQRLQQETNLQKSILAAMTNLRDNIDRRAARVSSIDSMAGDISTRIALGEGNDAALNENLREAMKERTRQIREMSRAEAEAHEENDKRTRATNSALNGLFGAARSVVAAFGQIIQSGMEFARTIGAGRSGGVERDLANRISSIFQFAGPDSFATIQQMRQAQQGLITTMVGTREGFQLSADGTRGFVQTLNEGFGTEFEMTSGALRALVTTGMSTRQEFEKFRKTTGLAGVSSANFERIVSKNSLSFMLYGTAFAKTAVNAERLGISLSAVQSAQESLVTNLDGTLDTVAQLNQLGSQVDFSTLVSKLEFEGPQATLQYLQRTIPPNLFQAASTRALVRQLGIPLEDLMKGAGSVQEQAANSIEGQMTETAKASNGLTKSLVSVVNTVSAVTFGFGGLLVATIALTNAMFAAAAAGVNAATMKGAMMGAAKMMGRGLGAVGGIAGGIGIGTAMGGSGLASGIGSMAGVGAGALLGTKLGVFGGPLAMLAGGLLGGAIGGGISALMKADDMTSTGYGNRTIVSPKGSIALNNSDTVVAGTNLGRGSDNGDLVRKIEELIAKLNDASTVIEIGGKSQRVPRLALVGVNSRYDVE